MPSQQLDQACSCQCLVGAVLGNRLEGPRCGFDSNEFFEFRNPHTLGFEIWLEVAGRHCGDVHADTALFLGKTATMDFGSANGLCPCDAALSRHKMGRRH